MSEQDQTTTPETQLAIPEVSPEGVQRILDHAASYALRARQLSQSQDAPSQDRALAGEYIGNSVLIASVLEAILPHPEGKEWAAEEIARRTEALAVGAEVVSAQISS